jgi:ABC-type spermidine/putrescine transport system permease subunit II
VLELAHAAVGATIAVKIPNPLIAIPLAFLSHFLLDFVPHWNPSLYTETKKLGQPSQKSNIIVLIDVALSLILGFFLAFRFWPNTQKMMVILLACSAAVAPDVIEGFYFYLGVKTKFLKKLIKFQHEHQTNINLIPGLLTQLATLAVCLYFLT